MSLSSEAWSVSRLFGHDFISQEELAGPTLQLGTLDPGDIQ